MFDPGDTTPSEYPGSGARLGNRYEIVSKLAAGGIGIVYSARDLALERSVAVKLLNSAKRGDERARTRLMQEARAMAQIAHPGIAQVFDHGDDRLYGPYLVMELLDGMDLARFLRSRDPLPLDLTLTIAEQACSVLQAAHDRGVYHRDVTPSNLFLVGDTQRPVLVKLIDFGVSRFEGDAMLTEPGDVLGTIAYMAPERWGPNGRGDARTDVYSLGVVVYEMLAGVRLFRGTSRTALRLAILHDAPEPLGKLRPELAPHIALAIERALRKAPRERFESVRAFASALGFRGLSESASWRPSTTAQAFSGTKRYAVHRLLAQSPHAEVYVAVDREGGQQVLLKRVRKTEPEALFRLKNEFRVAFEIEHPNLVRLRELLDEGADVLIVMDFVVGAPLLDYVASDEPRIRLALVQLARALSVLHARGLVHRDVKPDNVIVEKGGRTVLLDLGLTTPSHAREAASGTLPYVAPEALEGHIGAENDLFAVGVILHQALTGDLPKRSGSGGHAEPSVRLPDSELGRLCARLLESEPSRRPSAPELLAELASTELAPADAQGATSVSLRGDVFVGREDTLAVLEARFEEVTRGAVAFVSVEGASGIGKSRLLEQFGKRLARSGRALVLSSRARQHETVPFPALDEAIDQLSSYLQGLPDALVDALLPRQGARLALLFPVLARVFPIARAARRPDVALTPADVRRHASDALRELLRRLADRQPIVLLVDDLQWLDPDSHALLLHVLASPEPPPMLVVGAVRTGHETASIVQEFEDKLSEQVVRRVRLRPLSDEETGALIEARLGAPGRLDAERTSQIVHQTGGVPFFVELLVSAFLEQETDINLDLDEVLAARQQRLPVLLREVLELVAVSSRPVPSDLLLELIAATDVVGIEPLVSGRFVRLSRTDTGWVVEPYHARIREAVQRAMGERERCARHARLADVLRRDAERGDPELLVEHLAGSGETRAAGQIACRAAELALDHLAFARAAALFGVALTHGRFEGSEYVAIARRQAEALQSAGRRREAGEILLAANRRATDVAQAESLRRESGTHFLLSGDIDFGIELLSPALKSAGLEYPSPQDAIPQTFTALEALRSRGLAQGLQAPTADPAVLDRLDLCLLLAQGLAHIDLRALPFACHALHAALDAGDPARLQRALAVFVITTSGSVASPLIDPALRLCEQLTRSSPNPYSLALLYTAEAERAFFQSDFLAAEGGFERAERTLLASCAGTTRELASVRDMAVWVQYAHKGDFKGQVERTTRWLSEAESSRDMFHTGMLRVAHAIVWIAHDDPARARAELRKAEAEWTGPAGVLQVGATLYHDIIDRYEQNDGSPRQGEAARDAVAGSPTAQAPFLSGYFVLHETWRGLRRIAHGRPKAGEAQAIREAMARLRELGLDIWGAVGDALEANLDYLEANRELAILRLEHAEQAFRKLHMLCLAACARKRRGELTPMELGPRLEAEADQELRALGVALPARWTRAYWSMFDAAGPHFPTQHSDETMGS